MLTDKCVEFAINTKELEQMYQAQDYDQHIFDLQKNVQKCFACQSCLHIGVLTRQ